MRSAVVFSVVLVAFFISCPAATYADNLISFGKPVSGPDNGYYNQGSEVFRYRNVTDGRFNDTGSPGDWSFWLTPDYSVGYFVIDLRDLYSISKFELQNTLNRWYHDRGTVDYRISLSTNGNNYSVVVDSTLPLDLSKDTQSLTNPMIARYVRFDVDSYYRYGGGLNELSVYGDAASVPEPATFLLIGAGLVGVVGLRRKIRE